MSLKHLTVCCLLLALSFGCKDKFDEQEQFEEDQILIENYLAENNLVATKTSTGLHYIITDAGTGTEHPDITHTVRCGYVGMLLDGTVFDGTVGSNSVDFPLNGVIQGWQEGIPFLKRNGSGTFFIPSRLGYGNRVSGSIPKNSVLIFDVDLVHFY